MAWAEVQTANFANASSGSLGSNVTAGNSVILHGTAFSTSNVTISTSAPTFNGSSVSGAIQLWSIQSTYTGGFTTYDTAWLLPNLAGGAASVGLTFTNATMNTATGLQATEFSGGGSSPSIDNTNAPMPSTGQSNTTAISSGTCGATTNSADLIFGGCLDGNAGVSAGGSGFTNTAVIGSATVCGWQIPGSTGTFAYATTGASGGNSVAGVVAIAPSSSGTNVNLTTAALTLAAPAGSLAITSTVALNTPNLALNAPPGSPPAPAAPPFPQSVLNATVQLQLTSDGPWTDITPLTYQRDGASPPISITRGRPDESAQCNPGQATMQWNNRDGRFSPRNPTGPYYGQLGRNTPVRVSVPDTLTYMRVADDSASWFQCPDAAALQITGDMQVAIDMQPDNYMPCTLAAKWGGTGTAWAVILNGNGTVSFWYYDGSNTHIQTSTAPIPLGRVALFVNMNSHSTGLLTFLTAPTMGGTQTQLGAQISVASTNISAAAGQVIRVGWSGIQPGFQGQVYEFLLRNSAGTVVADPQFTAQTAGATSFNDAQSNTWTANNTAELSSRSYRFHGEASSLPQQWDTSGTDVWTPVTASGILRRLQQGNSPIISAMRRAVTQLSGAVAYWPAEDLAGATRIASGLPSGLPMAFAGTPGFATSSVFASSNPVPSLNGSTWSAAVPGYTPGTSVAVRFITQFPNAGTTNNLVTFTTTGTAAMPSVQINSGNITFNDISTGLFFSPAIGGLSGQPVLVSAELSVSGGTVTAALRVVTLSGAVSSVTTTYSGSIGVIKGIVVNSGFDTGGIGPISTAVPLGHVWVENNPVAVANLANPFAAWAGETAGNRFSRLCGENGVPARVYGFPANCVQMGPQAIDTLSNVLQACEDADHGMIYEPREAFGLGYRTLSSLCNQTAKVTLNYAAAHLGDGQQGITPTDDDQYTINDWTITNNNGSSLQATLNDGSAMSVSPPPVGVGDYASSKTLFLYSDSQLPDGAGWMLHVSTCSEERYPQIPVNLARTALTSLFYAIQNLRIGDYLAISNPPAWLPPGTISQIICGVNEQLGGFFWMLAWECVPESPYAPAVCDDLTYGRADTDGSTLNTGVSSGATSLSVKTTNAGSPLWTTSAGDFPFNVIMSGEVMTVTNITGSSSPQTFTVTRSVNGVVKAQTAGADIRLYPTPFAGLTS